MPIPAPLQTIIDSGNRLFTERLPLLVHWQELAENFYFERADFTATLSLGDDFAAGTFTSRPALYRREMGNMYRAMLRPYDFFKVEAVDKDRNKHPSARGWLQYATKFQRSVMYRRGGNFVRATVAGDHDHVTFGQCVIEVAPTPDRDNVFYRNWHLRDVVWSEDYAGNVADVHRDAKPTLSQLVALFGDKVPEKLRSDASKEPHKTIKTRHVVVPSQAYDVGYKVRADHPWVSLWVLPEHGEIIENVPRAFRGYVVPRADTVSGSQYARSPLTSIILPDARSTQTIERILLEAGEKAVDPPMIATMDAVRSDIGLYAGGITWVDNIYDERLGEALRPVNADYSGLPFGREIADRFDVTIREGLMTTKISLPDTSGMTAYQIRKIVEQHMRAQIPIFEPVEVDYNEPLCAETFAVMRSLGAFPSSEIPDALRGANIEYSFTSPIKDLEADNKRQMLAEGMEALAAGAKLDQRVVKLARPMEATKDVLRGIGWPEEWLADDDMIAAELEALAEQEAAVGTQAAVAGAAESAGKAAPMLKALASMGQAA